MKKISIERHRKTVIFTSVGLLIIFSLTMLILSYQAVSNGITLNVRTIDKTLGSDKELNLPDGNSFRSGAEGRLDWKPKNIAESMMLITVNNKNIDLLDILGLLVIVVIVNYTFKDSRNGAVFSKKMSRGFMMIIFAIGLTDIICNCIRMALAINYIPYLTHGQFKGIVDFKVLSFSYLIYGLLLLLARIPDSGLELQKETELTI